MYNNRNFARPHEGSNFAFDAATELCTRDAPYDHNSVCFGDSGGPVIANDPQGESGTPTEIGVIDSATIDCGTSSPDYYARIDVFLRWVDQLIASLTPPASIQATESSTKSRTELGTFPLAVGKTDVRTVLAGAFGQRSAMARGSTWIAAGCRKRGASAEHHGLSDPTTTTAA